MKTRKSTKPTQQKSVPNKRKRRKNKPGAGRPKADHVRFDAWVAPETRDHLKSLLMPDESHGDMLKRITVYMTPISQPGVAGGAGPIVEVRSFGRRVGIPADRLTSIKSTSRKG